MFILIVAILLLIMVVWFVSYNKCIYLDNNGTTYPYAQVIDTIKRNSYLGNTSGVYAHKAKRILSDFENEVRSILSADETYNVIITSGGSESNNLLLRGISDAHPRCHFILSEVEHKTSLLCCEDLLTNGRITYTLLPVDRYGCVAVHDVLNAIQQDTKLVSIMHINNETGCINDIEAINAVCQDRNIYFHSDIVQSFGKIPPKVYGKCAYSISMHKLHGGYGVGMLVTNINIVPQISGIQNHGLRGGTENISAIAGALTCLKLHFVDREHKTSSMKRKMSYLLSKLNPKVSFNDFVNKPDNYMPHLEGLQYCILSPPDSINTLLFSVIGKNKYCNIKMRKMLSDMCVQVSIGSTCNTNVKGASHVLKAIDAPYCIRCGVLRVSISDMTTYNELDTFVEALSNIVKKNNVYNYNESL